MEQEERNSRCRSVGEGNLHRYNRASDDDQWTLNREPLIENLGIL